jgi:hypothetical protein
MFGDIEKMTQANTQKTSKAATAAAVIIFLILIIGIPLVIVWWMQTENQNMLDKGCTPSSASNYLGNPTFWTCPIK